MITRRKLLKSVAPALILPGAARANPIIGFSRAASCSSIDPNFSSVVLLVGPQSTTAGSTIFNDQSPSMHGNATIFGDAQVSVATKKFVSSMSFDGTTDGANYASSVDWNFGSSPFTIECWVNPSAIGANEYLFGWGTFAGPLSWFLYIHSSGVAQFIASFDGLTAAVTPFTTGFPLSTGTWFAVAVDKGASNKVRIYLNGVMRGNQTGVSTAFFDASPVPFSIGRETAITALLNGFIEDIRVTKGVARYDSDSGYTPATQRFPTC